MGKAIIIKGANFAGNTLGKMENVAVKKLGTLRSLWSQATTSINTGGFGFLNDTDGYITSFAVYTSGAADVYIKVVRGGEVIESETINTGNNSNAITEHNITPIEVKSGDYIGLYFKLTTPNKGYYKASGGDIDTYTMTTTPTKDSSRRIYPFNFHITHWTD